jgi:hypothetical protein
MTGRSGSCSSKITLLVKDTVTGEEIPWTVDTIFKIESPNSSDGPTGAMMGYTALALATKRFKEYLDANFPGERTGSKIFTQEVI